MLPKRLPFGNGAVKCVNNTLALQARVKFKSLNYRFKVVSLFYLAIAIFSGAAKTDFATKMRNLMTETKFGRSSRSNLAYDFHTLMNYPVLFHVDFSHGK